MAGEIAQFFVRLGTVFDDKGFKDAAASINGLSSKADSAASMFKSLGLAIGAGGLAAGALKFGMDSLAAFSESEKAVNRLSGSMRSLGITSKAALQDQLSFAQEMQRTTAYSDEEVMSVQSLLTTYGLYGEKLKTATQAVLDLATRKGIDLHTATVQLGKAFDGETGRLKMLGIHFEDTGSKARNFEGILAAVNQMAGGAAALELNTYAGRVKNLTNQYDELKEKIGKELLPVAEFWLDKLNRSVAAMNRLAEGQAKELHGRELTIAALNAQIQSHGRQLAALEAEGGPTIKQTEEYKKEEDQLKKLTAARDREKTALEQERQAKTPEIMTPPPGRKGDDRTDEEKKRQQKQRDELRDQADHDAKLAEQRIMSATKTAQEIEMIETRALADRLKKEGQTAKAQELLEAQMSKQRKVNQVNMMNAWATALSNLTALSNAKTKEVAMLGKLASAAMAIIYGHMGGMLALAQIPPPWGFPIASLIVAAGYANAAMIMGVPLARGGLVKASPGGTQAVIGEAGSDEAVIPLSDSRALAALGRAIIGATPALAGAGGGGFGGVQVNQVFHLGAGAGSQGSGVTELMENIRLATRDGVSEAIDMAKQLYRTGAAEESRA